MYVYFTESDSLIQIKSMTFTRNVVYRPKKEVSQLLSLTVGIQGNVAWNTIPKSESLLKTSELAQDAILGQK